MQEEIRMLFNLIRSVSISKLCMFFNLVYAHICTLFACMHATCLDIVEKVNNGEK